ncbi:alpha/beta fold hydrolase [Kitasatospora griseola]|uniref:alpha/beta fold hydrolase n=1 Tax=Kitasatospora griseola TaxID=2064 RepID=UPI00343B9B00
MLMDDHRAKYVEVPGGYLHCRTVGAGRDVVLCNAGAADLRMWGSTLPWLAGAARVTTFDYRDTGLSSAGTEPYSEVEDIAAVFDAAGATDALLVGVSDGARRALAFAHRYPERVDRVVAVGGTFGAFPGPNAEEAASRPEMLALFARIAEVRAAEGMHASAAVDVDAWGSALGPDQRRLMIGLEVANSHWVTLPDEEYLGRELDPPVNTRFAELAVPVSVLVGGHDLASTRLWAERLAAQAPDAELTVLPGADHYPMLSAPAAFEAFLRALL